MDILLGKGQRSRDQRERVGPPKGAVPRRACALVTLWRDGIMHYEESVFLGGVPGGGAAYAEDVSVEGRLREGRGS